MRRINLLAPVLALLIASPFAMAQETPPAPVPHAQPVPQPGPDAMGHRMQRMHMRHGPDGGAFADLHALERLYREAGREKELTSLYNEVLAKSQDPQLRTYVYHRLARLQARPANLDQAIATLRKSLSENLASEAKIRAEHERMRTRWQQDKPVPEPAAH